MTNMPTLLEQGTPSIPLDRGPGSEEGDTGFEPIAAKPPALEDTQRLIDELSRSVTVISVNLETAIGRAAKTVRNQLEQSAPPKRGARRHDPSTFSGSMPDLPSATPFTVNAAVARVIGQFFPQPPAQAAGLRLFSFERLSRLTKRVGEPPTSPHYSKFATVARCLGLGHNELTDALGIKRTTPYAWKKGTVPRPATFRRIQQLYAFCTALVNRLGEQGAREWLNSGAPAPRDLLLAGDLRAAQQAAREILFEHVRGPRAGGWIPQADAADENGDPADEGPGSPGREA